MVLYTVTMIIAKLFFFQASTIIFFVLEDLFILRITLLSRDKLSRLSLVLKVVSLSLAWVGTFATGILLIHIQLCVLAGFSTVTHNLLYTHTRCMENSHFCIIILYIMLIFPWGLFYP